MSETDSPYAKYTDSDAAGSTSSSEAANDSSRAPGGDVEASEGSSKERRSSSSMSVKSMFLRLSEPLDMMGERIHSAVSSVLNSSTFTNTIDPIAEKTPDFGMPFRAVGKAAAPMVDKATDTVVTLTTDASRILVKNTEKVTNTIPCYYEAGYNKFEEHIENRKTKQPLISAAGDGETDYRNMTELDKNDTGDNANNGGAVEKVSADKDAVPFQTTNSKIAIEDQEEEEEKVVNVQKSDTNIHNQDDEVPLEKQGGKKNKKNKKGKKGSGDDKEEVSVDND